MASQCKQPRLSCEEVITPGNTIVNMFGWGSAAQGELGLGEIKEDNISVPRAVDFPKVTEISQIACGENYTVVLTTNGEVYSCGENECGQLGHDQSQKKLQLVTALKPFIIKKIACGAHHTVVINEWGQLFTWGCNSDGQLGLSSCTSTEKVPKMVKKLGSSIVVQVACGAKHTLALTNNGLLYTWGSNESGQLGLGTAVNSAIKPKRITTLDAIPIALIACGGYHSIIITMSGAIFGWGRNTKGQLGGSPNVNIYFPSSLRTFRSINVRYVACGEEFSAFLTLEGGVFTCGAGTYGQLGHGNNNSGLLPRKVMELMGNVVSQISCGKHHMLAFDPFCGRIYAWGFGTTGQLMIDDTGDNTAPLIVCGPWGPPNSTTSPSLRNDSADYVVKHIFAGGDHCFATVTKKEDNIAPDDYRVRDAFSQIATITEEQINKCLKIPVLGPIDHDLIIYIETVFRSLTCMNASFLLPNGIPYGCSLTYNGIDCEQATKVFGLISEIPNTTIQDLIFTSVVEGVMPSLVASPPDFETLRFYVILPLYHQFMNIENFEKLQKPFAEAVHNLKVEAHKILGLWWIQASVQIFFRLIRSYKAIVLFLMREERAQRTDKVYKNPSLKLCLDTLQWISTLNESESEDPRVPYERFNLPGLSEFINIEVDYYKCFIGNRFREDGLQFCNYPFLFDIQAKMILLKVDQMYKMQSAVYSASNQPNRNPANRESDRNFLHLTISREKIVGDTLRELLKHDSIDLKKPLKVKFEGEEAEDAGGVKKEFFMLLLREILDPKYGMFNESDETHMIWFSQDSFESEHMYFLIGVLCGLVIYNFIIIDLPFPLALYKKLLGEKITLPHLQDLSPTLVTSFQNLLDYDEPDLEQVFALNFVVVRDVFGEKRSYELIPDGKKVAVTQDNKTDYVWLYVDYLFNISVEVQFLAFSRGFHKVCGSRVFKFLRSEELMAVIVGNKEYDWREWEMNASYRNGYTKDDPTIVMFWTTFHGLSLEQKKKFLLFLTGSDRIPIQGMKAVQITFQPMADERFLPAAHTCFNLLDLPRYQTRERLRYKLLQAIQQTHGFSLV